MDFESGFLPIPNYIFRTKMWTSQEFTEITALIDLDQLKAGRETTHEGVTVRKNQNHTSMQRLADRWKWTKKKVRYFLDAQEKAGRIKVTTLKRHGIIIEFISYQGTIGAQTGAQTNGLNKPKTGNVGHKDSNLGHKQGHKQMAYLSQESDAWGTNKGTIKSNTVSKRESVPLSADAQAFTHEKTESPEDAELERFIAESIELGKQDEPTENDT